MASVSLSPTMKDSNVMKHICTNLIVLGQFCNIIVYHKACINQTPVERGRWMKPKLQYEMRKCTLCDSEDIEDEYHVTLVCQQFKNLRTKYIKQYYYTRPSMFKFIELMHVDTKREKFDALH